MFIASIQNSYLKTSEPLPNGEKKMIISHVSDVNHLITFLAEETKAQRC